MPRLPGACLRFTAAVDCRHTVYLPTTALTTRVLPFTRYHVAFDSSTVPTDYNVRAPLLFLPYFLDFTAFVFATAPHDDLLLRCVYDVYHLPYCLLQLNTAVTLPVRCTPVLYFHVTDVCCYRLPFYRCCRYHVPTFTHTYVERLLFTYRSLVPFYWFRSHRVTYALRFLHCLTALRRCCLLPPLPLVTCAPHYPLLPFVTRTDYVVVHALFPNYYVRVSTTLFHGLPYHVTVSLPRLLPFDVVRYRLPTDCCT